jgi:hypothetical protein
MGWDGIVRWMISEWSGYKSWDIWDGGRGWTGHLNGVDLCNEWDLRDG